MWNIFVESDENEELVALLTLLGRFERDPS
jgi:hypothetical protein